MYNKIEEKVGGLCAIFVTNRARVGPERLPAIGSRAAVGRGENGMETFRIPDLFSKTEYVGRNFSETETNLEIFSWKRNRK